jgi:membrane protein YqaA with SNARE-associated domain
VSSRTRLVLISAVASAVLGGAAAWAIAQARQSQQEQLTANSTLPASHLRFEPSPAQYVGILVALVALVRQISELFQPE